MTTLSINSRGIGGSSSAGWYLSNKVLSCNEFSSKHNELIVARSSDVLFGACSKWAAYKMNYFLDYVINISKLAI